MLRAFAWAWGIAGTAQTQHRWQEEALSTCVCFFSTSVAIFCQCPFQMTSIFSCSRICTDLREKKSCWPPAGSKQTQWRCSISGKWISKLVCVGMPHLLHNLNSCFLILFITFILLEKGICFLKSTRFRQRLWFLELRPGESFLCDFNRGSLQLFGCHLFVLWSRSWCSRSTCLYLHLQPYTRRIWEHCSARTACMHD